MDVSFSLGFYFCQPALINLLLWTANGWIETNNLAMVVERIMIREYIGEDLDIGQ